MSVEKKWSISTFQKKPKVTMCTEYRTLSLMSHALNIILRIILMRKRQNLRMICERYLEVNQDVYAFFIDCEKAFDWLQSINQ